VQVFKQVVGSFFRLGHERKIVARICQRPWCAEKIAASPKSGQATAIWVNGIVQPMNTLAEQGTPVKRF
ncbi:MAG: hypothetical protein AB1456_10870, partial [Thermodesulfobacteriota bacterium]